MVLFKESDRESKQPIKLKLQQSGVGSVWTSSMVHSIEHPLSREGRARLFFLVLVLLVRGKTQAIKPQVKVWSTDYGKPASLNIGGGGGGWMNRRDSLLLLLLQISILQLYCPIGIPSMGIAGCFPWGKPAATESRYPTYCACWVF